jgi:hypothetical protein
MKPRPSRTAKHAALAALVNGLTVPTTNLSAMRQTLVSGRVAGRMVRDYRLMCVIEAIRLIRLVETFLTNERQASPSLAENIHDFYAASSSELEGYASSIAVRPGRPKVSPKNASIPASPLSSTVRSARRDR